MTGETFYLTREGLERIKRELKNLEILKARKTKGEAPKILESEEVNPDYLVFQEDLDFLEVRITELKNILKRAQLIKIPPKEKQDIIDLGATVLVEVEGQIDEFQLVGTLEANPSVGRISNESPVGKALMGKRVGEEVLVQSTIPVTYKILKISYR